VQQPAGAGQDQAQKRLVEKWARRGAVKNIEKHFFLLGG
jgi:hypothetical protein